MTGSAVTIFVYGTLMRGMPEHNRLGSAEFQGIARTESAFTLYDTGQWPAGVYDGCSAISGELYKIHRTKLAKLDVFEGHPHLFRRQTIKLASGGTAIAWIYVAKISATWAVIASGRWSNPA